MLAAYKQLDALTQQHILLSTPTAAYILLAEKERQRLCEELQALHRLSDAELIASYRNLTARIETVDGLISFYTYLTTKLEEIHNV